MIPTIFYIFFFFNDTATTEIYTLSLHDALPISMGPLSLATPSLANKAACSTSELLESSFSILSPSLPSCDQDMPPEQSRAYSDRKSTRLNSSHANISYAVFCLKKKKQNIHNNYI